MLVGRIYDASNHPQFSKDFSLRDQIRRASTSIMLNIAEGYARKSDKEFSHFLFIAHGSVAEVQSALYVALDQHYMSKEQFQELYDECLEISRMISGLIKYMSPKRHPTS